MVAQPHQKEYERYKIFASGVVVFGVSGGVSVDPTPTKVYRWVKLTMSASG